MVAYDLTKRSAEWVTRRAQREEQFVWALIGGAVLATIAIAFVALGMRSGLLTAVLLVTLLAARRIFLAQTSVAERWLRGANAERAVGETLDELRPDFVVMHDLEQEFEGNVDHLVSGPTGVFMVETKWRSYQDSDLRKAKRQAAKLGGALNVWVTPVIALHNRQQQDPYQHQRVWIMDRASLVPWIRRQQNQTVRFERLASFADHME